MTTDTTSDNKCRKCGSTNVRYVQRSFEYFKLEEGQFPSPSGYVDLGELDETHDDFDYEAHVDCVDCGQHHKLDGEMIDGEMIDTKKG